MDTARTTAVVNYVLFALQIALAIWQILQETPLAILIRGFVLRVITYIASPFCVLYSAYNYPCYEKKWVFIAAAPVKLHSRLKRVEDSYSQVRLDPDFPVPHDDIMWGNFCIRFRYERCGVGYMMEVTFRGETEVYYVDDHSSIYYFWLFFKKGHVVLSAKRRLFGIYHGAVFEDFWTIADRILVDGDFFFDNDRADVNEGNAEKRRNRDHREFIVSEMEFQDLYIDNRVDKEAVGRPVVRREEWVVPTDDPDESNFFTSSLSILGLYGQVKNWPFVYISLITALATFLQFFEAIRTELYTMLNLLISQCLKSCINLLPPTQRRFMYTFGGWLQGLTPCNDILLLVKFGKHEVFSVGSARVTGMVQVSSKSFDRVLIDNFLMIGVSKIKEKAVCVMECQGNFHGYFSEEMTEVPEENTQLFLKCLTNLQCGALRTSSGYGTHVRRLRDTVTRFCHSPKSTIKIWSKERGCINGDSIDFTIKMETFVCANLYKWAASKVTDFQRFVKTFSPTI